MTSVTLPVAAGHTPALPPSVIGNLNPVLARPRADRSRTKSDAVADTPALILLGRDEADRPHASWFTAVEAPLATTAAGLMEMVTLAVVGDTLAGLAAKLPHGRLFASGKAFVPFVRAATFDALVAHLPDGITVSSCTPKPMKAVAQASPESSDTAASASAKLAAPTAAAARGSLPEDWTKLKAGNLVLASVERDDGWWPAIIAEDKGDGLYVLKWQDWTDWEPFLRRREQLALLHPNYKPE